MSLFGKQWRLWIRITNHEILVKTGTVPNLYSIIKEVEAVIKMVVWPLKNDNFAINPTRKGNGVKPIKNECMEHLKLNGWHLEKRLTIKADMKPGPLDAVKMIGGKAFALEWETENISSSHRAINKMVLGMLERVIIGGILILPSRAMYNYLTDRVGNFQELKPYFSAWKSFNIKDGFLSVIEIEHDTIDASSPLIPKGTDGWAEVKK
ncbi:BamHI-like type II restriction endonuclease [Hahella chejuensis KCTC 2396]|uniref:BamHI-like type II restriction endonuclease n=1 Tax=Hahella chejuensis (strain KCTC 2396) TaxID=349521 RepID=Q2SJ83_HAHCH|nr:BamHI type II restriction endonuclease [Hahella chejuensis]ABC29291.1 BamHI-like type II restriction endonuclease [Hahella chejuensis KCTC 2396]